MSLSDVIRNIAKTVTNKDEFKEKAKDLPLLVVQTTLSAAGQVLLAVDRVKNSIKNLARKEEREEETYDSRPSAAEQVAATPAGEEGKPARKEPVIFAPRTGAAEPNGVAKTTPDPVIFAPSTAEPAAKTESAVKAEPATKAEPVAPAAKPEVEPAAEAVAPAAESKAAVTTEAEPVVAPEAEPAEPAAEPKAAATVAAEPVVAEEVVEEVAEKPAAQEAPAAKPKARRTTRKAAAPEAEEAPVAEPAVAEPAAKAGELVEPLPGYDELTVASLRARMRGKTAEQIGDFLAYERARQARPEVVRMFENRLAKLQAGE